jgi:hypothetical protein
VGNLKDSSQILKINHLCNHTIIFVPNFALTRHVQGITFKERDRAPHLTAPLKNNKGALKIEPLKKMGGKLTPLIHLIHLKIS